MKKLITWYKQFFCRNIFGLREKCQRPCCRPSDRGPVADVNHLCSVNRYFKYNQSGLHYVFPYGRMYETGIKAIRKAGCHKSWPLIMVSMLLLVQGACSSRRTIPPLERKVTMPVYHSEKLESVMMRLALNIGRRFDVQVLTLSGTMAKTADYKEAPVGRILEEQLRNTPFTYKLTRKELIITKKRHR